jgi:hypothetical protein
MQWRLYAAKAIDRFFRNRLILSVKKRANGEKKNRTNLLLIDRECKSDSKGYGVSPQDGSVSVPLNSTVPTREGFAMVLIMILPQVADRVLDVLKKH